MQRGERSAVERERRTWPRPARTILSLYLLRVGLAGVLGPVNEFHRSLTGEAAFISQDGSVEIVLRVANVGAGMMDISLRLEEWSVSAVDESQIDNVLTFDGFAIDQSYLPGLATEVRAFLAENRISVKHPIFGK